MLGLEAIRGLYIEESPQMPRRRSYDSLLPPGVSIEHVEIGSTEIVAVARSRSAATSCPVCGRVSRRIHSRYSAMSRAAFANSESLKGIERTRCRGMG
jgi:hypothetical protein